MRKSRFSESQIVGILKEHWSSDVDPVPWIVFGLDFKLPLVLGARS